MKQARFLTMLAVISVFTGCAEMMPNHAQNIAIMERQAIERECQDFGLESRFEPLRNKVPLTLQEANSPPSLAQIIDKSKASDSEKALLVALHEKMLPCRQKTLSWADKHLPQVQVSILRELANNGLLIMARLYNTEMSFGEAWSERYNNLTKAQKALAEYDHAMVSRRVAEQQAATTSLMNTLQTMQMINQSYYRPMPATPITTNCRRVGNTVQCITN